MSTTWKQVVLDVADAWREANDSTAKIPVGQLPNKVKEGGENIDPELTTLESTLQEILEILPFKGAMASGQYVWKKLTAEGGTFIEFVISDDSTAYPDGGTQEGFWYEVVKNEEFFEFTNILSYTKCSVSKFTFSSRTAVNNAVTHPFTGEIPYFVMIASSKPTTSNSDLYLAVGVKNVEANSGTINMGSQFYYYSSSDQKVNRDTAAFGVNRNATGNVFIDRNNLYYAAGVEYYLIVAL